MDQAQDSARVEAKGKGKGAPRPPPPAVKPGGVKPFKGGNPPAPLPAKPKGRGDAAFADPRVKVGDVIEVVGGPASGMTGVVTAITGTGQSTRWKCTLKEKDNITVTWVKSVLLRSDLKEFMPRADVTAVEKTAGGADAGFNNPTIDRQVATGAVRRESREPRRREEDRKAMEAKMRAKASQEQQELNQRKEHYAALSPCDIGSVPWLQAKQMWYIDGGSGGIVLLDLADTCVVLKPQGKTAASELLAQQIAQTCGSRVAQCRIVRHDEPEHAEILKMHVDQLKTPIVGADEPVVSRLFGRRINRSNALAGKGAQCFGVLEYVPGHPLMGVQAQQLLATPDPSLLSSLGRLCALDVLINNMDRIPMPVWSNDGNFGNVMVSSGHIVGIDQQVNAIVSEAGLQMYFEKVEKLVLAVKGCSTVDAGLAKHLNDGLELNTGMRLTDEQVAVVQQGLLAGFEAIAQACRDGSLATTLQSGDKACRERFFDDPHKWDKLYDKEATGKMVAFVQRCAECIAATMTKPGKRDEAA